MLRSRHRSVSRRFVHAVMSMAIGTGMLAGATAITVLSTSSAASAKTQAADCTFNGLGNQTQGSPTVLVPFMINGGAAVTPGTTTVDIACTGLPDSTTMVVGIASPIAGFNSTTFTPTNALNEFMGGVSATGPDEPVSSETGTLTIAETVNADQQALDSDAVCPPTAAQVALGLSNCAMAVADLAGNEYGFAYVNYPPTSSYPVSPWPGTVPVPGTTGYASPPSLSVLNLTDTAAYSFGTSISTNGAASAGDEVVSGTTGANCGFNQLTSCTALPVSALTTAIAQGTTLLVGPTSLTGTHEIVVVTAPAAIGATLIWVNGLVNTYTSGTAVTPVTGSSAATAGDSVLLSGTGFWADPDGTLTEPLTVEATDSVGTTALLTANTQSPEAIGVDIYTATTHGGGRTFGSGGTFTGGTLALTETVPTGGLNTSGSSAAFVPGALTYAVVEPNVAPFNDTVAATTATTGGPVAYSYDTATATCNVTVGSLTTCPSPGPVATGGNGTNPDPVGAIGLGTGTLTVPLSVTTTSLPGGTVGVAYSATLAATGGTPTYTWALTGGTLPSWATLNSSTGAITGTPGAAGTTSGLVFKVTDSSSPAETATSVSLSITISPASAGPTVTKVTPNTGPTFGFTLVRIDGTNFIPAGTHCFSWNPSCGVTVKFGTHAAFVLYATATSIWVLSPAGTGTVDVTVIVKGLTSPTSPADHFTYLVVRHGRGFAFGFGHLHLHLHR